MCYYFTMNTDIKPPYNYTVENPESHNYGRYYYSVFLNDGRCIYFHADKVVVTSSGDMMAIREPKVKTEESFTASVGVPKGKPSEDSQATLVIASGQWTSFCSTAVIDGTPIAIDHIDGAS